MQLMRPIKRIAVIGAGVSGLVCAWKLQRASPNGRPAEVSVFEAGPRPGGTIATEEAEGFVLEKGPDSFINEKPWVSELSEKLGIAGSIIGTRETGRSVLVLKNGRLAALPEGFYLVAPTKIRNFLASPLFSARAKLRMGAELFIPKKSNTRDESVAAFVRRRFGREALQRVAQPMIAGIYSGDPERLGVLSALPRFVELEQKYGSVIRGLISEASQKNGARSARGSRYGLFLSFEKGMQTLVSALAGSLSKDTLQLNTAVSLDGKDESGRWVVRAGNQIKTFDAVCLAVSARQASRLLEGIDTGLADRLNRLHYESVATLNLAYRGDQIPKLPGGFGFVVPELERRSLTACTFISQKYEHRAPEGGVLLRAFVGGAFGKRFFGMDDRDLVKAVRSDLKSILKIDAEPLFSSLSRHPFSLPQYGVGHKLWAQDVEKSAAAHPGLFLTGSSYRGTGIANCVKDAESVADKLVKAFL